MALATTDAPPASPRSSLDAANESYLDRVSPGWRSKIRSPQFDAYLKYLPAAKQSEIVNSNDAVAVRDYIIEFDAWCKRAGLPPSRDNTDLNTPR